MRSTRTRGTARWINGKITRPSTWRYGFDSRTGYITGIVPGQRPEGAEARRPLSGHHGPVVYGLGSGPFKAGNGVRVPGGLRRLAVRQDRSNGLVKRGNLIRCRLKAGPLTVTQQIGVRFSAPEPW